MNVLEIQKRWLCKQAKKSCQIDVRETIVKDWGAFVKNLKGYCTWSTSQEKRMFQESNGK